MTFHASTLQKLRQSLRNHRAELDEARATAERRQRELTQAQVYAKEAASKVAMLAANVADCERWLEFAALYDTDAKLAEAFELAALRRDAEMRDARENSDQGRLDDGGALNDYGRDYAEEDDVRRAIEREQEAELAEEQAARDSLGGAWEDPAVRHAVRETVRAAESEA